jgi:hypothetical protein
LATPGRRRMGLEQEKECWGPGNCVEFGSSHIPMIQLKRGVTPRQPSGGGKVSQVQAAGSSARANGGQVGSAGV